MQQQSLLMPQAQNLVRFYALELAAEGAGLTTVILMAADMMSHAAVLPAGSRCKLMPGRGHSAAQPVRQQADVLTLSVFALQLVSHL